MLRIDNVSKQFARGGLLDALRGTTGDPVQALAGVSISVDMGECVALLGPNGAGKTTLMSICAGLIRPDEGAVEVAGHRYPDRLSAALGEIGLVTTSDRSFFWRLTGRQNLHFFAALQGIEPEPARRRTTELLTTFGLAHAADRRYLSYSTGMKKRLALARALLHDPQVLLLDEATNGLDAEGTDRLVGLVRDLVIDRGKAVLWATHRSEEVPALCDAVIVLVQGKVCYRDSVAAFLQLLHRGSGLRVEIQRPASAHTAIDAALERLDLVGQQGPTGFAFVVPPGLEDTAVSALMRDLLDAGARIDRVEGDRPSLADLFDRLREGDR